MLNVPVYLIVTLHFYQSAAHDTCSACSSGNEWYHFSTETSFSFVAAK